jgi:catechol 2,3-dioxygenase-like lactoylglutathione lyase family enzyme/uncharacterized protein YndB with AHSA1/START domain
VSQATLPLNQIAFAVLDLRRTEAWWREGLGFLPAGGTRALFRGPVSGRIQKLPGSASTCWCLLGRNDWCQLELFQYEKPVSKPMPADYRPSDLGYSRCGVWVADLDAALACLARLGSEPLAPPAGVPGQRRACVRNPDGVYVELMEEDPLPAQNARGRQDCPVAIRSATLSTPDMHASVDFLVRGLGMREVSRQLHEDAHEALWGLAGARCERRVFADGSGGPTMLLELVQYRDPPGRPFPAGYRLCDQRILNVCFGDPQGSAGVMALYRQALAAGAQHNCAPLNLGIAGCVYVSDPLGFSWEFMWATPGLAQRAFGFVPLPAEQRPVLDNQRVAASVFIAAPAAEVFAVLGDHRGMSDWAGLGECRLVRRGDAEPGGRAAERLLESPLGTIREQVTDWWPGRGYRYRIVEGSPFVGYWGEVRLEPAGDGTRVEWVLRFRSRLPGLGGLWRVLLRRKLRTALRGLQRQVCSVRAPTDGQLAGKLSGGSERHVPGR